MEPAKSIILDHTEIEAKLNRIAWEIYEANANRTELVMVGIDRRGRLLAEALIHRLREISPLEIKEFAASGGKKTGRASLDAPESALNGQDVIIVDDVLYSGKTLFRTLEATMAANPARIQVAVLIDRGHRSLPVSPDFVGVELATTLKQYVSVEIEDTTGQMSASLY